MRLKTLLLAVALAGGVGLASTAQAAPFAPAPAQAIGGGAPALEVAFGCGPGFTRGRFGQCRPIFGPRRFYGPRPYYGRRCFLRPTPFGPRRVCRY